MNNQQCEYRTRDSHGFALKVCHHPAKWLVPMRVGIPALKVCGIHKYPNAIRLVK